MHQVALKPIIYGSLAARLVGIPTRVNALGGLGFVFSSQKLLARMLRPVLSSLFRFTFNDRHNQLILQNRDDLRLVTENAHVNQKYVRLISGSGVDMDEYAVRELPKDTPIVMLPSRMLWDKGVGDFVEAAGLLRKRGVNARFVLVGGPDAENPSSVPKRQLLKWNNGGKVEWWGHRNDMPEVLSQARLICLPSYYGEGIPKILLEAAACGRAVVTTDMPGCRDAIESDVTGLLVPPRDAVALANAIEQLLSDSRLCHDMGKAGRALAEREV